ncbi:hypothetical protein AAVH_11472 [Aphelenchoides avenae]|nr:hypothetical protein AAVH_11472 [Aphelenchus avenae]
MSGFYKTRNSTAGSFRRPAQAQAAPAQANKANDDGGQKDFGDQSWKLTKARYGCCRYKCAACDDANFNNPERVQMMPDGYAKITEILCPSCQEGNIFINNVYWKYFNRQKASGN